MGTDTAHIRDIEIKVTDVSNALAHLGKGTSLIELLKLIHFPGYTTPVEIAFTHAILDSIASHTAALAKLETDLLAASRMIVGQTRAAAA